MKQTLALGMGIYTPFFDLNEINWNCFVYGGFYRPQTSTEQSFLTTESSV